MEKTRTIFTLSEAAELLNCHKTTLRKAILDGSLAAARLGRDYRISRSDLQQFWIKKGGGALFEQAGPLVPPLPARVEEPVAEAPVEEPREQEKKDNSAELLQMTLF